MADQIPAPPAPIPPPTAVQRIVTAILPQCIAYSRKGLVWFSSLSAAGVLELVRSIGAAKGWTDAQTLSWNNRILLIQGIIILVAKFWTDQIAKEDAALKTGLPAPTTATPMQNVAAGNITVEAPKPDQKPPVS